MSIKIILTILITLLPASIAITDENGSLLDSNSVNNILICKDGAGCLDFGEIMNNKCSYGANCDNEPLFAIHTLPDYK